MIDPDDLDIELFEEIPSQAIENFENDHEEETEDLLDNLGYISFYKNLENKENGENEGGKEEEQPSAQEVLEGIYQFREELNSSVLKTEFLNIQEFELSEDELDFLAKLSSLEGEFKLHDYSFEQIDADPLLSRVLNFRLDILNILPIAIGPKLSDQVFGIIKKLKSWTNITRLSKIIQLTGDIEELSELLAHQEVYHGSDFDNMVYFENPVDTVGEKKFRNDKISFQLRLDQFPGESHTRFNPIMADVLKDNKLTESNRLIVKRIARDEVNHLFIRLIQIRLWLIGSYTGKIDGEMGKFSLSAIQNLSDLTNYKEDKRLIYSAEVILHLGGGLWALNSHYLLTKAFPVFFENKEDGTAKSVSEEFNKLIGSVDKNKQKDLIKKLSDELNNGVLQLESKRRKQKKRNGKGFLRATRRFFTRIFKKAKNTVKNIINAIREFFKRIKNGVNSFLHEIKEAFAKLRNAVRFIFGRRIISTKSEKESNEIITDYDFDLDALVSIRNGLSIDLLDQHIQKVESNMKQVLVSLGFLEKALPIIINLFKGPYGWIKAGMNIASLIGNYR